MRGCGSAGPQPLGRRTCADSRTAAHGQRAGSATGFADAGPHSSHSLRRGFASGANDQGWDMKALMEYVGWHYVQSAMRYLDEELKGDRFIFATQTVPPGQ